MEVGEVVIDVFQFLTPIGVFMYLIEIKPTYATFCKLCSQFINTIYYVHRTRYCPRWHTHRLIEFVAQLDMLQQKNGFPNTSCTPNPDKGGIPFYYLLQPTNKLRANTIVFCCKYAK